MPALSTVCLDSHVNWLWIVLLSIWQDSLFIWLLNKPPSPFPRHQSSCFMRLYEQAGQALLCRDIDAKLAQTDALHRGWRLGRVELEDDCSVHPVDNPGRPERPLLVHPSKVERRKLGSVEGRAVLIYDIAHIEFNAVNLVLDAVHRFRGLPPDYYGDWLRVAQEEASHFRLLRSRLTALGFQYGDFTAHDGLWAMAVKTADDPLAQMALVPRIPEARGAQCDAWHQGQVTQGG